MRKKEDMIRDVAELLTPNSYVDSHPFWIRLKRGLDKMTKLEISSLHGLLLGKINIYPSSREE